MKEDPIVNEIRKARKQIEKECIDRGETLGEFIMRIQIKYKDRLVDSINKRKNHKNKKN